MNSSDCKLSGIEVVLWNDICYDLTSWDNQQVLTRTQDLLAGRRKIPVNL